MSNINYLTQPEVVSMADKWFDIATVRHFWVQWRFEFFKKFVGLAALNKKQFFEVGCGHGLVINQIEKEFETVVDGGDLNDYALKKIEGNKGTIYCYNIYQKSEAFKNKYDGVILFDVIEHIDDDVDFLITSCFHVKPGGLVMINVPAYQTLFSKYDTAVGHKRRYTKEVLKAKMEAAGIEEIKLSYWGFSLVPLLLIRKLFLLFKDNNIASDGFKSPEGFVNSFFKGLMKLEIALFAHPITGTSLMAYGKKK
jgi:2-polyprenyl-3-methyl-5-hydroxy-6-metoxy-1,4-benzoquinol methylase